MVGSSTIRCLECIPKWSSHWRSPPRFINDQQSIHVCRFCQSFYGLEQSPRPWFTRLSNLLYELGCKDSEANYSLFYLVTSNITIIYVDDIIGTISFSSVISSLIKDLITHFIINGFDHLHYFLGIDITKLAFSLHQS